MSNLEKYAQWIVKNKDKKGTPDFEKVAKAYKLLLSRQNKSQQKVSSSFADMIDAKVKESQDIDFDYTTGAPSGIRALVSFGETAEEKEAILLKKLGKDAYTKDSFGRLALTPEGQVKVGMTPSDKNVVLEERGMSWGDVADLAGILPETVGSVAGGVLGLGTGPLGVLTGAAGAAGGAMAGQAIEEGIEGLLGVQKQTLPEIGKDLAFEGALAGTVDLITVGTFRAGRAILGGAGRRLSKGQALDPRRGLRLTKKGYASSLERLGAPGAVGYAQKFAEGAVKDESRIINNTKLALYEKDKFLQRWGTPLEEAGESFATAATSKYNALEKSLNEARDAAMQAVNDSIKFIGRSVDENFDIGPETLDAIVKSFDNFQTLTNSKYKAIDDSLNALNIGDVNIKTAKVIPINRLDNMIAELKEEVGSIGLLDGDLKKIITGINDLKRVNEKTPDLASFTQINTQRRIINETLFKDNLSSFTTEKLYKFRNTFDELMDSVNIKNFDNIPENVKPQLRRILQRRKKTSEFYKEGLTKFDDLQKFGVIRSIREALKDGKFEADQFASKIIWKNSPERLKSVLKSVQNPEKVRVDLARSYLDKSMSSTGIDMMNPNRFNGRAFANAINNLGTTGKVLFGKDWADVKRLADTIGQIGFKTLPKETIDNIVRRGANKPIIDSMKELASASKAYDEAVNLKVIKDFNAGDITPENAVTYMTRKNITAAEVGKMEKFFGKNSPEYQKIRRTVIEKLLSSVDEEIFSTPTSAKALLKAMNQYDQKILERILGPDSYKVMRTFAHDLDFLGDLGKEGAIYSATFAAHPISKWRDRLRMSTTSKIFAHPGTLKFFANRSVGTPNQRVKGIMDAVSNAVSISARVLGAGRQAGAQAIAEQIGETNEEFRKRLSNQLSQIDSRTTPPVAQSGLGQVNFTMPNFAQPSQQNVSFRANPILNPNLQTQALVNMGKV